MTSQYSLFRPVDPVGSVHSTLLPLRHCKDFFCFLEVHCGAWFDILQTEELPVAFFLKTVFNSSSVRHQLSDSDQSHLASQGSPGRRCPYWTVEWEQNTNWFTSVWEGERERERERERESVRFTTSSFLPGRGTLRTTENQWQTASHAVPSVYYF